MSLSQYRQLNSHHDNALAGYLLMVECCSKRGASILTLLGTSFFCFAGRKSGIWLGSADVKLGTIEQQWDKYKVCLTRHATQWVVSYF